MYDLTDINKQYYKERANNLIAQQELIEYIMDRFVRVYDDDGILIGFEPKQ